MHLTKLTPIPLRRETTDRFLGLDRRGEIPPGAWADMRNLSTRLAPLLAPRPRRGLLRTLASPGGLLAKDALVTVENGTLCLGGLPTPLTGLAPGEKQLVSMGAYVLVFPDKRYYNTAEPTDFGAMEADIRITGSIRFSLCDYDGSALPDPIRSETEPADPVNNTLWLEPQSGSLSRWSAAAALWVAVPTVYTRLSLPTRGALTALRQYDGVTLSGLPGALSGEKLLYALGGGAEEDDYLVVVGLTESAHSEDCTLRIERRIPDMDFVCEANNRLWGCRYGRSGEKTVNELYASALGDFRNFRQFLGLSTDSWAASLGSDGAFTGAVNFLGRPCFFKEERLHLVTVSASGAHRLEEIPCRGVEKGSEKSLALVGETLYYKARDGICAWQGGFPALVSAALGETRYGSAVGGALGERYYVSLQRAGGDWELLCYDTARGLWMKEDALRVAAFAALDGELYALERDTGRLFALLGSAGEREESLPWMAETGPLHGYTPDRRYLARLDVSATLAGGSRLELWLQYDGEGPWERAAALSAPQRGSVTVPLRPRRCDHLRLRLTGEGEARVYALTALVESGSDR